MKFFPPPGLNPYPLPPGISLVPDVAEAHIVPCGWLVEDVCHNPTCVEKAYLEPRDLELALAVQHRLDMGLVEFSNDEDGEEQLLVINEGKIEAAQRIRNVRSWQLSPRTGRPPH